MTDTKLLRLRGNIWFFQYRLPPELAVRYGKKMYTQSLETSDIKRARQKRDMLISRLRAELDAMYAISPTALQRAEMLKLAEIYAREDRRLQDQDPEMSLLDTVDEEKLSQLEKDALRFALGNKAAVVHRYKLTLRRAFQEWAENAQVKRVTIEKNRRAMEVFLEFLGDEDIELLEIKKIVVRRFAQFERCSGTLNLAT